MTILYDIIFIFFVLLYLPYVVARGKWHAGFAMRLGFLPAGLVELFNAKKCLWFHAVSVGELLAIVDLIKQVREKYPDHTIVCTTVTTTGQQLARELLGEACRVLYAPLDGSLIVRKYIRVIRPKIYVSTETEIWPNLYTALHRQGVPVIMINGRISDRSYKGYRRIRFLTKQVLACVNIFCMQSLMDAERIERLGAPRERIRVVGNLKFESNPAHSGISKTGLGFQESDELLIAGSTHPGEEEILIDALSALRGQFSHLRLVIAPRHIERSEAITALIEQKGYRPVCFSQIKQAQPDARTVIVVDSIGQLRDLYSLATVVFIGKSLTVGGGQNMIEPASLGKPTVIGPLTQNFKDAVDIFLKTDAIIQVHDSEELTQEIRRLLAEPQYAEMIGQAAKQTVIQYQGASAKTLKAITVLISKMDKDTR